MSERDFNPILSRRDFLSGIPGALAAGYLLLKGVETALELPGNREGEEVIEADYGLIVPWSTRFWFPLVPEIARARGIPQIDPFLHQFDIAYRNKYDQPSYAEEWHTVFAEGLLKTLSRAEYLSAGFCHGVANAAVWQTPPLNRESTRYGITYSQEARIAFMAVKHAGDNPRGFTDTRSGIERILLDYFINSRMPIVANMPLGESGRWFRVIYQVIKRADGVYVRATNLGKADIIVPISEVMSVQAPDLPRNSISVPNLNSHWINPWVFRDEGVLLNVLINS